MKIKKIHRLKEKYQECDITTKNKNFFIKINDKLLLIHNSPALLSGYNDKNGKFFVGTKSIFNKNPKINYTYYDVDKNHTGFVAKILKECLLYLPEVITSGIYQGDFLYDTDSLEIKSDYVAFQPNTIRYEVPNDNANKELYNKIKSSKIGIAFHTKYTGSPEDKNLKASFDVPKFKPTKNVFCFRTTLDYIPILLDKSTSKDLLNRLKLLENKINEFKDSDMEIITSNRTLILTFINSKVRKNEKIGKNRIKELIDYLVIDVQKKIDKLKTQKAKDKKIQELNTKIKEIRSAASTLYYILEWHQQTQEIKDKIIEKLDLIQRFKTLVKTPDGFKATNDEGYVAINGNNAIKLVQRFEFSRNNFNNRG